MWGTALSVLLVAYLPGAVLFRSSIGERERRADLPAEERMFWYVLLSLALTSIVGFVLAAGGWYRFERLLWLNGSFVVLVAVLVRGRLRLPPRTPRPGRTTVAAAALVALCVSVVFHVPPSEYVMGGKDPGTYVNEGIQIAQRGTLTITDPLVASMPPEFRDLYWPHLGFETYHGSRFMGFYLVDPAPGTVLGQFPHLLPIWIAVGYGTYGLTGARYVIGVLSVLAIMAVYFLGSWMVGRPAAAAGAVLLAVNVAAVWYSRYPNAEVLMQVLVFAGLLAFSRASVDGDSFFSPVAAILLTLSFFAHLTGAIVIGTVFIASLFGLYDRRSPQLSFLLPLSLGAAVATFYYVTLMAPYIERQLMFVLNRLSLGAVTSTLLALGALIALAKSRAASTIRIVLPWGILVGVVLLASYTYFIRSPGGALSESDADALRTFARFYVSPWGLLAAVIGLAVIVRRGLWPNLAFVATFLVFSCFFFYKMRIIPEHFWAARRLLAVVLPGTCLLIGTAAFGALSVVPRDILDRRGMRAALMALGILVTGAFGYQYFQATLPILNHVEYAGLIPQLEALNAELHDSDLLIVESRQISDMHTLALPLAYIYARNVVVFWRRTPDMKVFREFLSWARGRYRRVLFMGGGGSGLPSNSMTAVPLLTDSFEVPEYESAYHAYPREIRLKAFTYGVYELSPRLMTPTEFTLDVGAEDDLYVDRFYAKETMAGTDVTFRWSGRRSSVLIPSIDDQTPTVTLWLNEGSRPPQVGRASVDVYINDTYLGEAAPTNIFQPFQFEIPLHVTSQIISREDAATLRLESTTWTPSLALGGEDTRELGVMIDRITLE